ncbi:MAG: hypothetical protein H7326_08480 [Bdellovibrionaceae bacterium]|nr:hypothetical protein [Pseudobdellovibrionaceae bacterium]
MKQFLAVFTGSDSGPNAQKWNALSESDRNKRVREGMQGWGQWMKEHQKSIVFNGAPLGKTKLVSMTGLSDIKNMMSAFVVVQADSQEQAVTMFLKHPHFTIFPGDGVEVMECMPVPKT